MVHEKIFRSKIDWRECGEIFVAGLELEELCEEGKSLFGGSHGDGGGQGGGGGAYTEDEVEYGDTPLECRGSCIFSCPKKGCFPFPFSACFRHVYGHRIAFLHVYGSWFASQNVEIKLCMHVELFLKYLVANLLCVFGDRLWCEWEVWTVFI